MRKNFCLLLLLWSSCYTYLFAQKKYEVSFQLSNPVGANTDLYSQYPLVPESSRDTALGEYDFHNKSYSIGAALQFNLQSKTAFRLRIDYTKMNIVSNNDIGNICSGMLQYKSYCFQNKYTLSPGYFYNLKEIRSLTAFVGAEMPITYLGKQLIYTAEVIYDGQNDNIYEKWIKVPSGLGLGIGIVCGINCNLDNNVTIGAEFSPSFQYKIFRGTYERIETSVDGWDSVTWNGSTLSYEGAQLSEKTTQYISTLNSSSFNYQNRFSINLTYKF